MPNIRVIYDNAANTATLTASTQASTSLGASNLLTDDKFQVYRSTGTSATLTLTWSAGKPVAGIILAFTKLTSAATVRARCYNEIADATPALDTGTTNANAGDYARLWFTQRTVKKLVIDISDATNPLGYIQIGRLVVGNYWSPEYNPDDVQLIPVELSTHYRTEAGSLLTDVGPKHKKQTISFTGMGATDRATFWNILSGNGMSKPIFVSMFPSHTDAALEQSYQIYGKLSSTAALTIPSYRRYAGSIDIEEI